MHSLLSSTGTLATSSLSFGGGCRISALGTLIFVTAVVVLTGLQLFLSRTNAGRQMRATAEDPDAAELVGINARAVYARGHGDRGCDRRARRHVSRHPLHLRSVDRSDAAHLRLRGGGDRRLRRRAWGTLLGGIVLGVAQVIGAQVNPQYFVLFGHLVFLIVLAAPRVGILARRGQAL